MSALLGSSVFWTVVCCGMVGVFLFAINEALEGTLKARIGVALSALVVFSVVAGFVFLGWKGLWAAGSIVLGGLLVAPLGYAAGRWLLQRRRGLDTFDEISGPEPVVSVASSEESDSQALIDLRLDLAATLRENVRILVGVWSGKLRRDYPAFFTPQAFERFIVAGTVAGTWLGCVGLHHEVEADWRTPLEEIVREDVGEWHPEGMQLLAEVQEFVAERVLAEGKNSRAGKGLGFDLAAAWVTRFAAEGDAPHDAAITGSLSELYQREIPGYWSV